MTDLYKVFLKKSAEKELRAIPKGDLIKIVNKIKNLSAEPRPGGHTKLSGEDRYRIRQGDWRVVYSIDDEARTVAIVKIGHRREVYR